MELHIAGIAGLPAAAHQLLKACPGKRIFAFYGEMGAGKTTFIKAICAGLGVQNPTSSPTFALVNEYHSAAAGKIYHFDFYRLKNETEALDMGCEEYFYSGHYCFIEWPEKLGSLLPPEAVTVKITTDGTARKVEVSGNGM
jgi:tRNA threonylcarbamoyladenosine biosynthesis protein TsaE